MGRLAFVSNRDGNAEIYTVNADGSNLHRITENPTIDDTPAWSPDGQRIAFTSDRDGNNEIYVMQADGQALIRLTYHPGNDTLPAWSPDGKHLAFISDRNGNFDIYTMDFDGHAPTRLTDDPARDSMPAWSPDGQRIAFASDRVYQGAIFVMRTNGSELKQLTDEPPIDWSPAWSPDGEQIAFVSSRDDSQFLSMMAMHNNIYVMGADGSLQTRLTTRGAFDYTPTWSPDGQHIAFERQLAWCWFRCRKGDINSEIFVMNADGTQQRRLTNHPAEDSFPAWAPE